MRFVKSLSIWLLLAVFFAAPSLAHAAPNIIEVTSKSGLKAWLVEDKTTPITALAFAFRTGMASDPIDKLGQSYLLSTLLDEGAGNRDSAAFQQELANRSIDLSFNAGRDSFGGTLRSLNRERPIAFSLLKDALTAPRFDAEPLERMRAAALSHLRDQQSEPDWAVARATNRLIFNGHPYSEPGFGTEQTLATITADDLRNMVKTRFTRDNLIIAASGHITAAELAEAIDSIFGSLPAHSELPTIPDANLLGGGQTLLVERPELPQSFFNLVHAAPKRTDPDYYAAQLVNYVLGGGGFSARLMSEVREKRGLTYGVYSSLGMMEHANLWSVSGSASNDKIAEAIEVIRQIWGDIAKNGITAAELEAAKAYITGSQSLELTSTSAVANLLLGIQFDHMPITTLTDDITAYQNVTLAQANAVAAKWLNPEKLATILAGNPHNITPTQTIKGLPQ